MEFGAAYPFVIAGYMGIIIALISFVLANTFKLSRLQKEIDLLNELIKRKEKK
ncbi:MAG: hypothetical protein HY776_00990 [Actinobacteria bacterium]|nr:hypothetical protein [Actinomycetota bacterium]